MKQIHKESLYRIILGLVSKRTFENPVTGIVERTTEGKKNTR